MFAFEVSDMTCGHCVTTITKAVHAVDKDAEVEFDLAQHLVKIQPGASGEQELSDAIKEAGYTPVPASSAAETGAPAKQGGCCCR